LPHAVTRIDRREFGVRFLRLAATLALPTRSTRAAAPEADKLAASDHVVVQRDIMIAMRDGVHLATDLYFPGPLFSRP
jgi:predicted acyl esterase